MRHARIKQKARFLDQFIDDYKRMRKRKNFPHQAVEKIMPLIFRRWRREGRGAFKTVHRVSSTSRHVALKTASAKHIRRDWRIYKGLSRRTRNRYFAKIYWTTKYCLLQKYGKSIRRIPRREMHKLKRFARENGLWDVRPANIRRMDGHYKIVDANKGRRK